TYNITLFVGWLKITLSIKNSNHYAQKAKLPASLKTGLFP
ncbi:MAG: hypothetical protein ACI9WT_001137, partial [Flavobacterium sp.]